MISKYYKYGVTFEQMDAVEVGDEIQLEREGKVTVTDRGPSVRKGDRPGKVIQRSAIVRTEDDKQRLLIVTEDSEAPQLVTF